MAATLGAVLVVATVLTLVAANGKTAVKPAATKGVHPGVKPAASRHTVVVVRGHPAAHRQPHYDYWRPWYTFDTPKQHHGRKDSHRPAPHHKPQAHKQPHRQHYKQQQHWGHGSAYRNMEWGRGDKAKVDYVKEAKPVAYDTIIQEEKKVVIKEEPKLVLKEVPKVVVKEQPKVIIQEQPKVIVKEVPTVIVKEVHKKHKKPKKHKPVIFTNTHGHHGHDCFSDWFKGLHTKGKKSKKHHKSPNTLILLRPHAPYYYYTQAPRYYAGGYNGYNGYNRYNGYNLY